MVWRVFFSPLPCLFSCCPPLPSKKLFILTLVHTTPEDYGRFHRSFRSKPGSLIPLNVIWPFDASSGGVLPALGPPSQLLCSLFELYQASLINELRRWLLVDSHPGWLVSHRPSVEAWLPMDTWTWEQWILPLLNIFSIAYISSSISRQKLQIFRLIKIQSIMS